MFRIHFIYFNALMSIKWIGCKHISMVSLHAYHQRGVHGSCYEMWCYTNGRGSCVTYYVPI